MNQAELDLFSLPQSEPPFYTAVLIFKKFKKTLAFYFYYAIIRYVTYVRLNSEWGDPLFCFG